MELGTSDILEYVYLYKKNRESFRIDGGILLESFAKNQTEYPHQLLFKCACAKLAIQFLFYSVRQNTNKNIRPHKVDQIELL